MMKYLLKNLKRLRHSIRGILYALQNDFSYQWQVVAGLVVVGLFSYWQWPLGSTELFFLILGWVLILITELQNSSFESALDKLHPDFNEKIGHSKDMAAGAVLTAGLFWIFVMLVIALT